MPHKGKRHWLKIATTVVLTLLCAAIITLTWLASDTERVRHTIEKVVSEVSDRPLKIEGEFNYTLGRIITVRADKIRWRNPAQDNHFYMLEVGEFTGSFDLFSLFDGPLLVTEVQAGDAVLRFGWGENRDSNWALGTAEKLHSIESAPPIPLPLIIEQASVRNIQLYFQHPALTEELEIKIKDFQQRRDQYDQMAVSATALLEGRVFEIDGQIGPFPELLVAGAVGFDVTVVGPLATFSASGKSSWLSQIRDPELRARLVAPSAFDLVSRLKLPLDTTGSVELNVDLNGQGEAIVAAANGFFGEYQLDAKLHSNSLSSLHGMEVAIQSKGPSIGNLAVIAGLTNWPDSPYELDIRAKHADHEIDIQSLRLETKDLNVNGSGIVRTERGFRDIDLELNATGSNFASVAPLLNLDSDGQQPFSLKLEISGKGKGISDVVDVELRIGDAIAKLAGTLAEAEDYSGSQLKFSIDAPEANQLASIVGTSMPAGVSFNARGLASIMADRINLDNLSANLDGAEITGAAWMTRKSRSPEMIVAGDVKGANLANAAMSFLPDHIGPILPQLPFSSKLKMRLSSARVDIESVSAKVGKSKLDFSGGVDLNKTDTLLNGQLSISNTSLADLFSGAGINNLPEMAFKLTTRLGVSSSMIRFSELSLSSQDASIHGELALTGKNYSRVEFDLTGDGNNLASLIPENAVYHPVETPISVAVTGVSDLETIKVDRLQAKLGGSSLKFLGEIQIFPDWVVRNVQLNGSGPRLSELGSIGSWKLVDRPFKISGLINSSAKESLVKELSFESGKNNLSGNIRYWFDEKTPWLDLELNSSYMNLDEIRVPRTLANNSEAAIVSHGRLFSDDPLPFEMLEALTGSLSLKVDEFTLDQRYWRNLTVDASLNEGVLHVRQLKVDAAEGKLKISGIVKPASKGTSITAEISATHAMAITSGMAPEEVELLPHHAIAARLSASGRTPHELAASLNGYTWIMGGSGRVKRSQLGLLAGGFLIELVDVLNPLLKKKNQQVGLDCQGVYFEIVGGKIETAPAIVYQTEHSVGIGIGTIDLASEKIDMLIETTPRKGIMSLGDLAHPFIKIGGTLADPKIIFNPKAALIEGSAAIATAGLSVLAKSLWERWIGTRQICEKVAAEAVKIRSQRDRGAVPDLDQLKAGTRKKRGVNLRAAEEKQRDRKSMSVLDKLQDW